MKPSIVVLTATRAEYGLLSPIVHKLIDCDEFEIRVVATGAHLSPEFGMTVNEIIEDGIAIDKKIEILLSSDTPVSISKSMGLAMISFAEYFDETQPDALLVLGDRYETLAVCCAAMNARIPIIHLYGGETTEGAVDEAIRHSITKMSYLHMTSTEQYRKRVIQLGEDPDRVYTVGSIGIENALTRQLMTKEELADNLQFDLSKPYAVVTFHPTTLEGGQAGSQFLEVLKAFDYHSEMHFIFTKANADANGRIVNKMIDEYVSKHKNTMAVDSLGTLRYLSAVKYADMVIGNSSSGIVEVPSFRVPTINIGDRQKGRIQAQSIINCEADYEQILDAIQCAVSEDFLTKNCNGLNPYGDGKTSQKVVEYIIKNIKDKPVNLKKKFYDICFYNI